MSEQADLSTWPCAYLGWKGENPRGKEGEGLPLEQLTLFPVKLAEDTGILQGEHWDWSLTSSHLARLSVLRAWILVMGAKMWVGKLELGLRSELHQDAVWWGGPIGPLGEFPQQPALAWEVIVAGLIGRYLPFPSYHFLAGTAQRGGRDWGESEFQTSLFTGQVTALPGVRVGAGVKPQMNLRTKIQLGLEFE